MATTTGKTRCVICNKEKATLKCGGCLQDFCYNHWDSHRQELNKQFDEIEINRDLFKQSINQFIEQPNNFILIQQINQWEQNSIKMIQQIAEEAREKVHKNKNEYIHQLEIKLNKLTNELRESRHENDFNEITVLQYQADLKELTKQLTEPSTISIREDSTSFINKISVEISQSTLKSNIDQNTRWIQNGVTIAGGNGQGNGLDQFNSPCGIYVDDDDQTVYVADFMNHRVVKWRYGSTEGQIVAGGNGQGDKMNQLNAPTDVIVDKEKKNLIICDRSNRRVIQWPLQNGTSGQIIIPNIDCNILKMDKNGYIYISDWVKHEVRRWRIGDTEGTLVAGGNGKGNNLNQLNWPAYIFVDDDQSVYVSDYQNHRVMKWIEGEKEGIVVAGGQGQGNALSQLSGAAGLVVDQLGTVYVADRNNHRIMRWFKGATQGTIIVGGNGQGDQNNQFHAPECFSSDQQGNLYIVDRLNERVQKFNIDQS